MVLSVLSTVRVSLVCRSGRMRSLSRTIRSEGFITSLLDRAVSRHFLECSVLACVRHYSILPRLKFVKLELSKLHRTLRSMESEALTAYVPAYKIVIH